MFVSSDGLQTRELEAAFVTNLPLIDRIVERIAGRYGLDENEADEFRSWSREKLIDGGYAIFKEFRGHSLLSTYLTVVLTNLFRDYRNARWGRWRPSAAAKRLGPLAVQMERLIYRDGCPIREAIATISSGAPELTEADLVRLYSQIPPRVVSREIGLDTEVSAIPWDSDPLDHIGGPERARTEVALNELIDTLPAEDQVIIRLRYWESLSVAEIGRTLGLDGKPLYGRLRALQRRLKLGLTAMGIDQEHVDSVLGQETAA